jgi:hypothetical protein
MPRSFAASTWPWPATMPPARSIRTGLLNPNRSMLSAIWRIYFFECVRGLIARGFRSAGRR